MHLSVTCPQCQSKYQLDPGMRGKRMRCPNTICRAVFEVRDDNDPRPEVAAPPVEPPPIRATPAPPPPIQAKPAPPAAPPAASKEPPVSPAPVKAPPLAPKERPTAPKKPRPTPDFPDDFPGDDDAAVPPAPALETEAWQPEPTEFPPPERPIPQRVETPPEPAPRRRYALWIILGMMLILGAGAVFAVLRIRSGIESNEAELFSRAEDLYKQQEFADASAALQKLHRDFPDSEHNKKYRFLAELSDVRQAAYSYESPDETVKALERILQFVSVYKDGPLLKERTADLWDTLGFLSSRLTKLAEDEKAPAYLPLARHAWTQAKKYAPADAGLADRERKRAAEWVRVEQALAGHVERLQVIAVLKKNAERATASSVAEAWALVEQTRRAEDPEIRALLDALFKAHREQVRFEPHDSEDKEPKIDEDALAGLVLTPGLQAERAVAASGSPILALARGVLHALEPTKGELLWARRVGVDTHVLPVRVPADAITPELLLVLSSDQRSLSGVVAATGATLWQTPLSDACVAFPLVIDRQALVPTLSGHIDEIELAEGRRLGAYHVGQSLSLGGVHQPGTPLAHFPGDDFCVYTIDVRARACTNILYTRHPPGSLRGLPIVAVEDGGGWLFWTQQVGLNQTELKPYALPLARHDQKPLDALPRFGALSAGPWHDADRVAVLTESGMLSLWGRRLKGTRDPLLFPILRGEFPVEASTRLGRCQVVHGDPENIWTMVRGRLQRVEIGFDRANGPAASVRWTVPVELGHLLHAAQWRREPDGRTVLFVTTQASDRSTCLTSAIDGETGKIAWQRQIGNISYESPRRAGGTIVLAGPEGLLGIQPTGAANGAGLRKAGEWIVQDAAPAASSLLLTSESGFVRLTFSRSGTKLRAEIGPADAASKVRVVETALPALLQGTPAQGDGFLLLPLANGIVVRLSLADGAFVNGPDWRAAGAEERAPGYVVMIGAADFAVTDGSRGLQRVVSTDGKAWDRRAAVQLEHRITAPPAVLPGATSRLCVRDASDTLTLLDADRLVVVRRWTMPGKVTAGPFVRSGKIGCVIGRNRLVWLDPDQEKAVWEYGFVADVVGEPNVIEGMLVVADVAGQFVALDPASGRALGAGYTMKANVAATAPPLAYAPGQILAPLTDGTLVVLPLDKLRAP